MAAFTTIAAATVAVGGSAAKGFLAGDAAKVASREAGRLELEQERLEQESVARLEQNFYDALRATTDIYDKQMQQSAVEGAQILEAAQEGDQRGVAATAGKIKQSQDVVQGAIADKFAEQKLKIDMKRAEADETDAAKIAELFDDRAAAAGLEADAKRAEADQLKGVSQGAFIDAGVSALNAAVTAFGGAEGRAANKLVETGEAANLTEAQGMLDALGTDLKGSDFRKIIRQGTTEGFGTEGFGTTKLGDILQTLGTTAKNSLNFKQNKTIEEDKPSEKEILEFLIQSGLMDSTGATGIPGFKLG